MYEVIIIGAGHAGCEAALAASRMGANTLLLTISVDAIGHMSCNPAIGGLAKGNLVKDLDALGGEMGKNADASAIQMRILNRKKGPAVRSSRAQTDKYIYRDRMTSVIMEASSLDVKQAIVTEILIENKAVVGVLTACGQKFLSPRVILCGGTFIGGEIYIGSFRMKAGRMYEPGASELSENLKKIGFKAIRLKTDTPARLHADSINTAGLEEFLSDPDSEPFSTESECLSLPRISCHITHTNRQTHRIIRDHLHESVFYNGSISGIGPRYCPSIEDKVLKFPLKEHHNIILEPEGLKTKEIHVNGFSTSLPADVQLAAYRTICGLENCEFTRPAYAIQYDVFQPTGLFSSYETKLIKGLYFAGQLNGTSGYEEAAVQGFMAGVNAVLSLSGKDPLVLGRHESYIGVLTDDLVTKGVEEPYRMFSSRGEYRLLLREDNAEERLINYGRNLGLISESRYLRFCEEEKLIEQEIKRLNETVVRDDAENRIKFSSLGVYISQSYKAQDLLRRPEISYRQLMDIIGGGINGRAAARLETRIKYAGYIQKQKKDVEKYSSLEGIEIPENFSYENLPGLRAEYAEKLTHIKPSTLAQASRIPGIPIAAVAILDIELARLRNISEVSRETI